MQGLPEDAVTAPRGEAWALPMTVKLHVEDFKMNMSLLAIMFSFYCINFIFDSFHIFD